VLLYYITDRAQFAGNEESQHRALLEKIAEAARCGIDFIQLREKDLSGRELESLARAAVQAVRENSSQTRILINSRSDVALACGADGVHLRSDDVAPSDVRTVWSRSGANSKKPSPCIAVSCHSPEEVARAQAREVDFVVFAPVFEKKGLPGARPAGIAALREACRNEVAVLALGGITVENAHLCRDAGAAGLAGIRLFQEHSIAEIVQRLRG